MKKRFLSIILTVFLVLSMLPYAAFADNDITCPACGGSVTKRTMRLVATHTDFYKCDSCGRWAYLNTVGGFELLSVGDSQILDAADSNSLIEFSFNDGKLYKATKAPSGIGGKDLPGYAGEGVPNYNSSGAITIMVEPYALGASNDGNFFKNPSKFTVYHLGSSGSGTKYYNDAWCGAIYKFIAPVDGVYYVGSFLPEYNFGYFESFSTGNKWSKISLTFKPSHTREFASTFEKGDECYFIYSNYNHYSAYSGKPYRFKLNYIPIFIDPLDDSGVTKQTNITINNNTFNGNIYVDSSNKLTYIYPQYTINNETKISNNPIIYNQETKQYYTYDQTTNNYYYITYGEPAPTPTPSPSPDPGGSTPDPGKPTPTPTPGGSDSSGGGSGSNPFKWLGELFKDILDGIIKGLWRIITSIFGFILWLLSLLFKLFPWMPNSALVALCGGVVVVTIIRIIKFITGR